ncbi:MAG: hypothetical protein L3J75_07740 [Methylococcaceae bacterium]|nr:hypothetical protein [Methylococcaceae bacterium]
MKKIITTNELTLTLTANRQLNLMWSKLLMFGMLLIGFSMPLMAQQPLSPRPTFDPIKKTMCRLNKMLYEVGTVRTINGKEYKCTLNNGWVLLPK